VIVPSAPPAFAGLKLRFPGVLQWCHINGPTWRLLLLPSSNVATASSGSLFPRLRRWDDVTGQERCLRYFVVVAKIEVGLVELPRSLWGVSPMYRRYRFCLLGFMPSLLPTGTAFLAVHQRVGCSGRAPT